MKEAESREILLYKQHRIPSHIDSDGLGWLANKSIFSEYENYWEIAMNK